MRPAGDPIVLGGLPREVIDAVIKRRLPAIRHCYQRALQADPGLAGGLAVKFAIARDGTVSRADAVCDTLADPRVADCVVRVVHGLVFPEPQGLVVVTYPFLFQAG